MDEVDRMVIGVRADTSGFAHDVDTLRTTLEGALGKGAERAGRSIETSLLRAVTKGKLGFDALKATALSALEQIAGAALKNGVGAVVGAGEGGGIARILAGLIGLPGRATGGPVAPGCAYRVGERGPELFVPTASGRIETGAPPIASTAAVVPVDRAQAIAPPRDVRVSITINAPRGETPAVLQRSSRQVARAVRAALAE